MLDEWLQFFSQANVWITLIALAEFVWICGLSGQLKNFRHVIYFLNRLVEVHRERIATLQDRNAVLARQRNPLLNGE